MASTFTSLVYHLVFSTKDRAPIITPAVRDSLYGYIGGILRGEGGSLLEIGGVADHVHLLTRLAADHSVATMVRLIKANSSRWMNQRSDRCGRFAWQSGYGAFSVSSSQVAGVRRYIQNQETRHAKASFRDELIALLARHGVEYDERYLLG